VPGNDSRPDGQVGLFSGFQCRDLVLSNRVVMPPMCQYKATTEGFPTDWHLVHYGARAAGGAGLIVQEATAVEARGRLSENDLGIWHDDHVEPLRRLVEFCREQGAKVAIQLAHGGRKSWAGGEPIVGPTIVPFKEGDAVPVALDAAGIEQVIAAFQAGARRAVAVGYDAIELHGAHGYLINQFLSPYSNTRRDEWGGDLEGRLAFLRRITVAVREVMPAGMPLFLRVSAHEYVEGGLRPADLAEVTRRLQPLGLDLIDVSSGGAVPKAPERYPGYQVPFAQQIRQETGMPVMAVGRLENPFLAEACVRNGWADLVCVGRGMLVDAYWPAHAAQQLGVDLAWSYQGQEP
jgi:NADPH2 dehydrogenase